MIDWLRRKPDLPPSIEVAGAVLPVAIRRSPQARRLTMRLAPDGTEIRMTLPRWASEAEALAFARGRRDWLARQLASVPAPAAPLGAGSAIPFGDRMLIVRHDPKARRRPLVIDDELLLGGPEAGIAQRVARWLYDQARAQFALDLAEYCERAELAVPRLMLSRAQRRWGSCARDGTIRINWRLVMAPVHVRRSVVAHEVAHLVHFDHSPRFHTLLDQIYEGDIRDANDWLKRHGRSLYQPLG